MYPVTRNSCCSPASESPMIQRPARAWSARTTATSSRPAGRPSSREGNSIPSWARPACRSPLTISMARNLIIPGWASSVAAIFSSRTAVPPRPPGAPSPPARPAGGVGWKQATAKWYRCNTRFNTQGSVYAHRDNYMDLDPTYKDALGRPLVRMTYNGTENDHAMSRYLVAKLEGIIRAMNPTHYEVHH